MVHRLKGRFTSEVKLIEESGDGLLLLEAWRDASSVFVIDAMSSGGAPGPFELLTLTKISCLQSSFCAQLVPSV